MQKPQIVYVVTVTDRADFNREVINGVGFITRLSADQYGRQEVEHCERNAKERGETVIDFVHEVTAMTVYQY